MSIIFVTVPGVMRPAKLLIIIGALVFYFSHTGSARACSCSAPATTSEALKQSTVVFKGRVVKISVPTLDWIGLTRTGAQAVGQHDHRSIISEHRIAIVRDVLVPSVADTLHDGTFLDEKSR